MKDKGITMFDFIMKENGKLASEGNKNFNFLKVIGIEVLKFLKKIN